MQEPTTDVSLAVRCHVVHQALSTDGVLTAGTLQNAYDLLIEQAASFNLYTIRRHVNAATDEGDDQSVTLIVANEQYTRRSTNELCLLAGVAELRYQLGIQTYMWCNEKEDPAYSDEVLPGATWIIGAEYVAVDYDTGDQPLAYLVWRAERYQQREFVRQIWGAPTRERRDRLEEAIKVVDPSVRVFYAPYSSVPFKELP